MGSIFPDTSENLHLYNKKNIAYICTILQYMVRHGLCMTIRNRTFNNSLLFSQLRQLSPNGRIRLETIPPRLVWRHHFPNGVSPPSLLELQMPGPGSLQEAVVVGVALHQRLEGLPDPLLGWRRLQDGILDLDHAALGARDGALDDDDAQVVVNLEHRQVLGRRRLTSHAPGHLLARVDPGTTTLRGTDGTARTVVERVTVRLVLTAEAVPLHATLETHTATGASHVDPLSDVEPVRLELHTDGQQTLLVANAELGDVLLGLDALGLKVAQLGGEGGGGPLGDGTNLDGKVAGVLAGLV